MKHAALSAALASALVISAAGAGDLPPMDVMGPYDTPESASDRIVMPERASDAGVSRPEAGVENTNAVPPEPPQLPIIGLPGPGLIHDGGHGPGHGVGDVLDLGLKPAKPEKPDKPDDGDDGDDDGDG